MKKYAGNKEYMENSKKYKGSMNENDGTCGKYDAGIRRNT